MKRPPAKIITLIALIAIIALFFLYERSPYSGSSRGRAAEEAHQQVAKILEQYDAVVPEKLPAYLKDLPVAGTVNVTAASKVDPIVTYGKGRETVYEIKYYAGYGVVVRTDTSFDRLSDAAIYDRLKVLSDRVDECFDEFVQEELPEFKALENGGYSDDWHHAYHRWEYTKDGRYSRNVIIKTLSHTYEWAENVKNYFVMDDKDHFVKSAWDSEYESTSAKSDKTRCAVTLCHNRRESNSIFCSSHKCAVHDCPKQRIKTDIYCRDHSDEFAKLPKPGYRPAGGGHGGKSGYSESDAEDWAEEYADEFGGYEEAYEYYEDNWD